LRKKTRAPDQSDWRLLRRLGPYAKRYRLDLILSLSLLAPLSIANAIQPVLVQRAIDGPIKNNNIVGLRWICLLLMVTIAARLLLQAWEGFMVQKVGQKITADIRNDLFHHITQLSTSFFDRTPVGKLITRLTSDVEALGDVFATGAVGIFSDLASIVVIAVVMFLMRWDLALLLTLLIFPMTGLIVYFQYEYRKANFKARERLSELNSILQENIIGVGIVQLFRRQEKNSEQHQQVNDRYLRQVNKTIFHDSAVSAFLEWIAFMAIGGCVVDWRWAGGQKYAHLWRTIGIYFVFAAIV
jgi:ATP-binding cassette subfamily B multidrug efflux pump